MLGTPNIVTPNKGVKTITPKGTASTSVTRVETETRKPPSRLGSNTKRGTPSTPKKKLTPHE